MAIKGETTFPRSTHPDKGTPIARWVRKATGLSFESRPGSRRIGRAL
jgi:hypothetical protein